MLNKDSAHFVGTSVSNLQAQFTIGSSRLDVSTSDSVSVPEVMVIPLDDSDASRKLARETKIRQIGNSLNVSVPHPNVTSSVSVGGSVNISGIHCQGPVNIVNGVVYSGHQANVMMNPGVRVSALLPSDSSITAESISGDVAIIGSVTSLSVRSVSGDVTASGVGQATITTTSGDVNIANLTNTVNITTVSGDVSVDNYSGSGGNIRNTSGYVVVCAGDSAHGDLNVTTISGAIRMRKSPGLQGFRFHPHTVSGRIQKI